MATQLGQFNANTYILSTDSNGVIADLKFKSANQNTVTAGYDGSKVTFKNGDTSLSVEAALSAEICTGNAATASKLQTTRKISGVDFDGSKDINLPAATKSLSGMMSSEDKTTIESLKEIQFDTWTFDYEGGSITENIAFKD